MKEFNDKQGMTTVWSDGEKLIVKNAAGKTHVSANIEAIFGDGEFEKMHMNMYSEEYGKEYGAKYELITGYIPGKVRAQLGDVEVTKPYNEFFE